MSLNGGTIGNGYASFLLGLVDNATMGPYGGIVVCGLPSAAQQPRIFEPRG